MKIAVIGSGISGLSSAYYLSKKYEVDLFEKDDHFGGHSYTFDIKETNKKIPVDLGFIVFNKITYPNLINFFEELNTEVSNKIKRAIIAFIKVELPFIFEDSWNKSEQKIS